MHKDISRYTKRGFAKVAVAVLIGGIVGAVIFFLGFTQVYEIPADHRGLVLKNKFLGVLGDGFDIVQPGVYPITGFRKTTQVYLVKLGPREVNFQTSILNTTGKIVEKATTLAQNVPMVGKLTDKLRDSVKPKDVYGTMTIEISDLELARLAPRIVKEKRIDFDKEARAPLEAALNKHYKEADAEKLKEFAAAVSPELQEALAKIPLSLVDLKIKEVREKTLASQSDGGKLNTELAWNEKAIAPLPVTTKFLVKYVAYGLFVGLMLLAVLAMLIAVPANSQVVGWLDVLGGIGEVIDAGVSIDL